MSLLFMDGFDHYASADFTKKWNSMALTIHATNGRRGAGCAMADSGGGYKSLGANYATFIVGAAVYINNLVNVYLIRMRDAGSPQLGFWLEASGAISVLRGSTVIATSSNTVSAGAWYYIELKGTIHNSTGSYELRVNGVNWASGSGVDTQATANAYVNELHIQGTGNFRFDDLYLCDNAGSAPQNDFLGDCRIDTLLPNADGNYTQFTPSTGTDHYALVDEATPNTTDYNEESTVGEKDSYGMQNLSAVTGTIFGVQVSAAVLKDDAGSRSIKVGVRSSSTDSLSSAQALSTSQLYYMNIHATDPATSAAWTESGVNAAEALVECA